MISHPSPSLLSRGVAFLLLCVVAVSGHASAQCSTQWLPGSGFPGTDFQVYATTMWDPDGAGPMPPILVLGGDFTIAGTVLANRIATYDPVTGSWSALGSGMNGGVSDVATPPKGDRVVGEGFTVVNGVASPYIARLTTTCPATADSYCAGCTGSGGPNVQAATSLPWTGSTFRSVATAGSWIAASTLRSAPHRGHTKTSNRNSLFSRSAHE